MVGLAKRRVMGASGALLLVMSLVLALGLPAAAEELFDGNCTLEDGGWAVGATSGPWGSLTNNGDGSVSVTLNTGYSLELCVKGGDGYVIYDIPPDVGPFWPPENCGQNNNQCGLSHWGIRGAVFTPPTEETTPTTEDTTPTTEGTTPTTEGTTPTTEGTTPTTEGTTPTTEGADVGGIVVTLPSSPQVSNTTASTTASTLPFTGMSTGSLAVIGAALAAMGTLLLVASRRVEDKTAGRHWV
ncbi:MAG: hypothetical protein WD651_11870 [Acidimicrobiia bacterium]